MAVVIAVWPANMKKLRNCWREKGFSSISFDVKLSRRHDVCSEAGFFCLLEFGCRQLAVSSAPFLFFQPYLPLGDIFVAKDFGAVHLMMMVF